MSYYKREGNRYSYLQVCNVTWHQTTNPSIIRLWTKPHIIGVVDKRNNRWIVNNKVTKEYFEGQSISWQQAKQEVIAHMLATLPDLGVDIQANI